MRPANKEPQWTTVYDDLFNQYVDTDGFEFGTCNAAATTSSSDEASNNDIINSIEGNYTDSGDSSIIRGFKFKIVYWDDYKALRERVKKNLTEQIKNLS
ncbi:MAG: hypothetical protein EOO02_16025 [Chitinophagaceae bacterium]|nr:MAG: hypothetical protein EOO02_16025 [Chitinophagaceae bacterium]